jgi:hypothetical protein
MVKTAAEHHGDMAQFQIMIHGYVGGALFNTMTR